MTEADSKALAQFKRTGVIPVGSAAEVARFLAENNTS